MKNSRLQLTALQFLECACCLCWFRRAALVGRAKENRTLGAVREFSTPLALPQSPAPPGSIIPDRRIAAPTCPPSPTASAARWSRLALPLPAQSGAGDRWRIRSSSWRGLRQFASGHRPLLRPALRNHLDWTVFPSVSRATSVPCSQIDF